MYRGLKRVPGVLLVLFHVLADVLLACSGYTAIVTQTDNELGHTSLYSKFDLIYGLQGVGFTAVSATEQSSWFHMLSLIYRIDS
jgi:hypothetical protein